MKSIIPHNLTGKSLYDYLVKNEGLIFHAKKSTVKKADEIHSMPMYVDDKGNLVSKAEIDQAQINPNKLKVSVVINTTNWLDSHGDVHIPGIWKKTLSDNKKIGFYLLECHGREFEDVIAEGCKGSTKKMSWGDLGIDVQGVTEALIFDGIIEKDRNEYMFDQYRKGYVKKHSVGMRYIKMLTCINDDDYPVQKENWDKYIQVVANRDEAEADGYFWAILEAQIIEGSAVLFGSNPITPTMETEMVGTKSTKMEMNENTNIEFIDMMIPHHEAAIVMVNDYQSKVDNQELIAIMNNIKTSQQSEIDKMTAIRAVESTKENLHISTKSKPLTSTYDQPLFDVNRAIKEVKIIV